MVVTADDCFVTKFDNSSAELFWDRDNTDILCRCLDSACNVIELLCVFLLETVAHCYRRFLKLQMEASRLWNCQLAVTHLQPLQRMRNCLQRLKFCHDSLWFFYCDFSCCFEPLIPLADWSLPRRVMYESNILKVRKMLGKFNVPVYLNHCSILNFMVFWFD